MNSNFTFQFMNLFYPANMNILIGPQWRCYTYDKSSRTVRPAGEGEEYSLGFESGSFAEFLGFFSGKWQPDLVLLERPEYLSYPLGIEKSPLPIVAMVGDWNICFNVLRNNMRRFDWIVVDKKGVEVFRNAGYNNVDYFPVYAYDAAVHHLRDGFERAYDVVMIGNLNHEFQREREKWLKRLTSLDAKFKIRIFTNIFGEEYPRTYNQAKIVFNRSIRGEMNERAYEAAANGALLFYEEKNLEIRDFLVPGKECVLYNEENFEELIEYYLSNEEERKRIAEAGHQKIGNFNRSRLLGRLIEILVSKNIWEIKGNHRSFERMPESNQYYEDAKLALQEVSPRRLEIAQNKLDLAVRCNPKNYEARNALSMVHILTHEQHGSPDQQTNELFDKCLDGYMDITEEIPFNSALVFYNLGFICQSVHRNDLAESQYEKAVQATYEETPLFVKEHFFPRDYLTFRLEWEKISALNCHNPKEGDRALKLLLRWQCSFLLGGLCLEAHRIEDALTCYSLCAESRPDLAGRARIKTAEVLAAIGKADMALEEILQALALEPFNTDAWSAHLNILNKAGHYRQSLEFCDEILLLIERCPFYEPEKSWLIPFRDEAKNKSSSIA